MGVVFPEAGVVRITLFFFFDENNIEVFPDEARRNADVSLSGLGLVVFLNEWRVNKRLPVGVRLEFMKDWLRLRCLDLL